MAKVYIVAGKVYLETAERMTIVSGKVLEETTAAPTGASIINQLQQSNVGAYLYNGTIT